MVSTNDPLKKLLDWFIKSGSWPEMRIGILFSLVMLLSEQIIFVYQFTKHFDRDEFQKYFFGFAVSIAYTLISITILICNELFLALVQSMQPFLRPIDCAGNATKARILKQSRFLLRYVISILVFLVILSLMSLLILPGVGQNRFIFPLKFVQNEGRWLYISVHLIIYICAPFLIYETMYVTFLPINVFFIILFQLYIINAHARKLITYNKIRNFEQFLQNQKYQDDLYCTLITCIDAYSDLKRFTKPAARFLYNLSWFFLTLIWIVWSSMLLNLLNSSVGGVGFGVTTIGTLSCSAFLCIASVVALFSTQGIIDECCISFEILCNAPWYVWNRRNKQTYLILLNQTMKPICFRMMKNNVMGYEFVVKVSSFVLRALFFILINMVSTNDPLKKLFDWFIKPICMPVVRILIQFTLTMLVLDIIMFLRHFEKDEMREYLFGFVVAFIFSSTSITMLTVNDLFINTFEVLKTFGRPIDSAGTFVEKKILKQSRFILNYFMKLWIFCLSGTLLCFLSVPGGSENQVLYSLKYVNNMNNLQLDIFVHLLFYMCVPVILFESLYMCFILVYMFFNVLFQMYIINEYARQLIVWSNIANFEEFLQNRQYQKQVNRNLVSCIQAYSDLKRFTNKASVLFYIITWFYMTFLWIVWSSIILYFDSLLAEFKFNTKTLGLLGSFTFVSITTIICFYSTQQIVNQCKLLFEILSNAPWYVWNRHNKRIYLMFLKQTEKPIYFYTMKNFFMGYEFAVQFARSIISLLVFIKTILISK